MNPPPSRDAAAPQEVDRLHAEVERLRLALSDSNKAVQTLHAELEDRADALQRAADVRGRVVANVSHEFRTPLHTILGLSKLLLDGSDGVLNEEQQKQVRFIRSSSEELAEMVNDLLDLSKVESGKMNLRVAKFSVSDLLAALRGMLQPLTLRSARVQLVFDELEPDVWLETDRAKLSQVMRNLISNALKFTDEGEVRVRATLDADGYVTFSVSDSGIGISERDLERVFEEYAQIEGALQSRVKGTGLGLPLSRRLAELLGGRLTARSELGKGSTFSVCLPVKLPEVAEMEALTQRSQQALGDQAPVLVVEDDRKTIFLYEKYLAMAGFAVMPARTVEDARRALQARRPAAIVLDVMLEGETTWEFLGELKKNPATSDIPVLVVTITNREQKARALGADEFWLKPVDQDQLLRKLKSITRPGHDTKVLLIDDDELSRYLLRKLLSGSPYALIEAATGTEGIARAQQDLPQVIFLDFLLKQMTAFDVLDALKADPRTRNIPVIIATSHTLDSGEKQRLASVTEAILSKESLSRELAISRIRDALGKAGVRQTPVKEA